MSDGFAIKCSVRNLEDRKLQDRVAIIVRAARALGFRVTREVEAAFKAYAEALKHPDSLVRITMPNGGGEENVFNALANLDRRGTGDIDWVKTSSSTDAVGDDSKILMVFEFKNGSAIELRCR